MSKVLKIHIEGSGVCWHCSNRPIMEEPLPDDWDEMSEEDKEHFAKETFWENFSWTWTVGEEEQ